MSFNVTKNKFYSFAMLTIYCHLCYPTLVINEKILQTDLVFINLRLLLLSKKKLLELLK